MRGRRRRFGSDHNQCSLRCAPSLSYYKTLSKYRLPQDGKGRKLPITSDGIEKTSRRTVKEKVQWSMASGTTSSLPAPAAERLRLLRA